MRILEQVSEKYRPGATAMPELQRHLDQVKKTAQAAEPAVLNQMLIDTIRNNDPLYLKIHTVALLIDEGADLSAVNDPFITPMQDAYKKANGQPLKTPPHSDLMRMGALEWAAELGYTEIVSVLCEAGADMNAHNKHAAAALFSNRDAIGIKAMLRAGASLNDSNHLYLIAGLAILKKDNELLDYALTQGELNNSAFQDLILMCNTPHSLKLLESYIEKYNPEFNIYDIEAILRRDAAPVLEILIRQKPELIEEEFDDIAIGLLEFRSIRCLKVMLTHYGHIMDLDELEKNMKKFGITAHSLARLFSAELDSCAEKKAAMKKQDVWISQNGHLNMRKNGLLTRDLTPVTLKKLLQEDSHGNTVIDYLAYRHRLPQLLNPALWKDRANEFETLMREHIPPRYRNKIPPRALADIKAQISIQRHLKTHPKPKMRRRF